MPLFVSETLIESGMSNKTAIKDELKHLPCNTSFFSNLGLLDTSHDVREHKIRLMFDMRSFVLASAINLGIMTTEYLLRVDASHSSAYKLVGFIDQYQPGMDIILCVDKSDTSLTAAQRNGPDVCFMTIDNVPLYHGGGHLLPRHDPGQSLSDRRARHRSLRHQVFLPPHDHVQVP